MIRLPNWENGLSPLVRKTEAVEDLKPPKATKIINEVYA